MLAHGRPVVQLYLRTLALFKLIKAQPLPAARRLRDRNRQMIVSDVFILAG
jgi:hypothetical protein